MRFSLELIISEIVNLLDDWTPFMGDQPCSKATAYTGQQTNKLRGPFSPRANYTDSRPPPVGEI
jgi:hypothetical protein